MRQILSKDIQRELNTLITNKTEDFIYSIYDEAVVFRSNSNDVNESYCKDNNITVVSTSNFGGTIVASEGDMGLAIIEKEGWNRGLDILNYLCMCFNDIIPNLRVEGNDLIADSNYKLASFASTNIGDRFIYTIVAISINPNITHIRNICSKHIAKVPRGFQEYNVTANEIVDLLKQLTNTND